jgi:hypothetical protein
MTEKLLSVLIPHNQCNPVVIMTHTVNLTLLVKSIITLNNFLDCFGRARENLTLVILNLLIFLHTCTNWNLLLHIKGRTLTD